MIVAVYSAKGGVGKTTLAVNLAWASAVLSKRRTLLWDLDAQAGASYILGQELGPKAAKSGITHADVSSLIRPSNRQGIDIIPADESLRHLDVAFHDLDKRKRLAKIASHLEDNYDRVIIDAPPGTDRRHHAALLACGGSNRPAMAADRKGAGEVTSRTASCRCGQLSATASGEPVRVSVCHCLDCKKRSGSAFAVQARWPADRVKIEGRSKTFVKVADSGNRITFHFCPDCGCDVHYAIEGKFDGLVAIPVGAFDDPYSLSPRFSVWEKRKHDWVEILGDAVEHSD